MKTHMKVLSWLLLLFPLASFALIDGMESPALELDRRDVQNINGQATYAKEDILTNCPVEEMDWSMAEIVLVNMKEYKFSPNQLTLKACHPYILRLTNEGDKTHNFVSRKFFATLGVPRAGNEVSLMTKNDSERLNVKENREIDFAFVALVPGKYQVQCTHLLHASRGMKGTIIVE